MRDWNAVVRNNLKLLDLTPQQQEEIVSELASHLEDEYEQLLAEGLSEAKAFDRCIETAGWRELGRNIRRAKEDVMNHRVRTLWLPSLATFAATSFSLMFLQFFGSLRPTVWFKGDTAIVLEFPWLVLLPLCGALGAYLSLRAGGKQMARLASALSPVIIMLAVFCLVLPFSIILDHGFVFRHPMFFLVGIANSTLVPGLMLLLGAFPLSIKPANNPAVAR